MATPLETFQAWEASPTKSVVHVMQIDRGDNSAANRLTLTDKPYYDKGVSGSKYHATYPAPIQAIISEIVTDEQTNRTSFDDIILANGSGKFDALLSEANILGHRFTMLRGDKSWSLMETDLPNRFVEIFRGQVEGVKFERGRVRLVIAPVKYKLDNVVGAPDTPIAFGKCRNVPGTLVDAATDRYRFNTVSTGNESDLYFIVRDNGVQLNPPGHATPDYSYVLEGGEFKGLIEMAATPAGKLTADLNQASSPRHYAPRVIRKFIVDYLATNYPTEQESFSDASSTMWGRPQFSPDGTSLFVGVANGASSEIRQYTLSDPDDITTATLSVTLALSALGITNNLLHFRIDPDGESLVLTTAATAYQLALASAWSLSGATNTGNSVAMATITDGALTLGDIFYHRSAGLLYAMGTNGRIYRTAITGNDISTASSRTAMSALPQNIRGIGDGTTEFTYFDFSADGKKIYLGALGFLMQWELPSAYDPSEAVRADREYYYFDSSLSIAPSYDGNAFYAKDHDQDHIHRLSNISNYDLPRALFKSNMNQNADIQMQSEGGVFYKSETPIGRVLADLVSCLLCDYTVDLKGAISLYKIKDPSATAETETVYFSDFLGRKGEHIRHEETLRPIEDFILQYDTNFTPQSESELAGAVTAENKEYYANSYETLTDTAVLTDAVDPGDKIYPSFIASAPSAGIDYTADILQKEVDLYGAQRNVYTLSLRLPALSLVGLVGVGDRLNVGNDWRDARFSISDKLHILGMRTNWSKNQRMIRVLK